MALRCRAETKKGVGEKLGSIEAEMQEGLDRV